MLAFSVSSCVVKLEYHQYPPTAVAAMIPSINIGSIPATRSPILKPGDLNLCALNSFGANPVGGAFFCELPDRFTLIIDPPLSEPIPPLPPGTVQERLPLQNRHLVRA